MRKLLLTFIAFYLTGAEAQTVSTFMETGSNGCYGLAIEGDYLYVVSSFNGKVHRKALTSNDATYETFDIGASGYQGICKIGNYIYVSKPFNGTYGIYRFNPDAANNTLQLYTDFSYTYGLAHRNSELYFIAGDKISKLDVSTPAMTLVPVADDIAGVGGSNGSTIGLKVYGNYLYVSETTGISRFNLDSANFEKETITDFSGTSFALGDNNKLYLTGGEALTGVYEVDLQDQTLSLLTQIDNFIGTYDIVYANNALFVTTREGDYNKVAKIDLESLNTGNVKQAIAQVFPNPANGYINLVGLAADEKITIINQCGQVQATRSGTDRIDVSDLSAGVYFIKTKNWIRRFVKE